MRAAVLAFGLVLLSAATGLAAPYTPPPYSAAKGDGWATRTPAAAGMDAAKLAQAIKLAQAHENSMDRNTRKSALERVAKEQSGPLLGPFKDHAPVNGLVLRHGYIVAEFGETGQVDMTFSVAKSFVSTTIGLAVDDGLIGGVDDPVRLTVKDGGYNSPHNAPITWRQSLQQASEWEGVAFGKADTADRRMGRDRKLQPPGSFYEYNDVRVNRTALSSLRVWKRPLADVLRERIMRPIGTSNDWRWVGYDNGDVEVEGRTIRSVPGGGHWGGGMWITTRDLARVCLLYARDGQWNGRQLISKAWIKQAMTPSEQNPEYGYMWWLNTKDRWPGMSPRAFGMLGAGGNGCYIDPDRDLVIVMRWLDDRTLPSVLGSIARSVN